MLPYCGRSMLEGQVRDLQAQEYLYWHLTGTQVRGCVWGEGGASIVWEGSQFCGGEGGRVVAMWVFLAVKVLSYVLLLVPHQLLVVVWL